MLFRVTALCFVLALAASLAVCDTVVYQEDFSGTFVEHDWIYNNSGGNNETGYGGQLWPCKVDSDGKQILGYEPTIYFVTNFDRSPYSAGAQIGGTDGWNGTGEVVDLSYHSSEGTTHQSVKFVGQAAYRNVTDNMRRTTQYVQCYMKVSAYGTIAYLYAGTTDAAATAVAVRFGNGGRIEALNGNGSGGGTWVPVKDYVQNAWYKIRVKIDYATSTYEVSADRSAVAANLGFVDAAASAALGSVKFDHPAGPGSLYVDDVYAGNSPYAPGPTLSSYWSDQYNRWCQSYGYPLSGAYDTYDWMNCSDPSGNPVNTDPAKTSCYQGALPAGWTAAFDYWGDCDPFEWQSTGRGKMGFGPLMGAYAQAPSNRCLHVFSSQGNLRVVSPLITSGPGVYTLSWKGGVWNGNTADPAQQYKWTDWCQWGFGYTNWGVWDDDPITTPPYSGNQAAQIDISRYWAWLKDPFHNSDPDGVISGVADGPHPEGEEPGMWHSFSRTFAFGYPPVKGEEGYEFNQEPGWFIGFNVAHAHDSWNQGFQWTTILNVDDIVLTKKDPVSPSMVQNLPIGTLVELADMVLVNIVPFDYGSKVCVDLFLETKDRTAGAMVRVTDPDQLMKIWTGVDFTYQIGDVMNVVGAVAQDDINDTRNPQPDTRNPVKYIAGWLSAARLPAIVQQSENVDLKPIAITGRDAVGAPVANGLSTNGMLVAIAGRVNTVGDSTFYVDDGSGVTGYGTARGIKVDCTRLVATGFWFGLPYPIEDGSFVRVVGALTAEKVLSHTTTERVIYPRTADDLVYVAE